MTPIEKLVEIKSTMEDLKIQLAEAMPAAIEQALSLGKRGLLGSFLGAKVTLKFKKVVPSSNEADQLKEFIKFQSEAAIQQNAEAIAAMRSQAELIASEIQLLSQSQEGREAELELKTLLESMAGEVLPELAVSFK